MNFYYYLFYLIANYSRSLDERNPYVNSGAAVLSTCLLLNLMTIVGGVYLRFRVKDASQFYLITMVIAVLLIIMNYWIFYVDKKGERIFEKYQMKVKGYKSIRWYKFFAFFYFALTVGLILLVGFNMREKLFSK